ncbi:Baeyer-Villiger monooxygenase [Salix suchowensis]|nr:Baeyer-Villiger monooxygenase [Salix suchowensis]
MSASTDFAGDPAVLPPPKKVSNRADHHRQPSLRRAHIAKRLAKDVAPAYHDDPPQKRKRSSLTYLPEQLLPIVALRTRSRPTPECIICLTASRTTGHPRIPYLYSHRGSSYDDTSGRYHAASTTTNLPEQLDVLLVGAGFAGIYQLYEFRKRGYSVKAIEAASELGGTWHWNRYPGARVDTTIPIYEFSIEEVWKDWTWKERFPGQGELEAYFKHVDEKLDISRDVVFNTRVLSAKFNARTDRWAVTLDDGRTGVKHHTSRWPKEGVEVKGKRVAVIGTGATGVQVIQEIAPHPDVHRSGLYLDPKPLVDLTPEARRILFEELWVQGGFRIWLGNHEDVGTDPVRNDELYAFWRTKALARIKDKKMQEKLAPAVKPHPFGHKRISCEHSYFEIFNQSNVELVDMSETDIAEFTPKGIRTTDGVEREFDVIVLATGFDSVTGGITQIDIEGPKGTVRDKWAQGLRTYLGVSTADFPNMFWVYGPHGPTAFCNGPYCAEMQGGWIVNFVDSARKNGYTRIEAQNDAEEEWTRRVQEVTPVPWIARSSRGTWGQIFQGRRSRC